MNKKKNVLALASIYIIWVTVYSIFIFKVLNIPNSLILWVSYFFTIFSYFLSFTLSYLIFIKEISPTNRFLGLPLHQVGIFYAVIQTILSVLFILLPMLPEVVAAIIQITVLAIILILLISTQTLRNYIENIDNGTVSSRNFILGLANDVLTMSKQVEDANLKKQLNLLYEKLRYSDPISNVEISDLDNIIENQIYQLRDFLKTDRIEEVLKCCTDICALIEDRNIKCKNLKK